MASRGCGWGCGTADVATRRRRRGTTRPYSPKPETRHERRPLPTRAAVGDQARTVRIAVDGANVEIERVGPGVYVAAQPGVAAAGVKLEPRTADSDPQLVAAHCLFALTGARMKEGTR